VLTIHMTSSASLSISQSQYCKSVTDWAIRNWPKL